MGFWKGGPEKLVTQFHLLTFNTFSFPENIKNKLRYAVFYIVYLV